MRCQQFLRDYFYRLPNGAEKKFRPNLYEMLRIPASASPAELRVAFKLRNLELAGATRSEQVALERAFNILGQPELRACYDALLVDSEAPAVFPYGGFGSLLLSGERSRDGQTFFAQHILSFSPELTQRRFHLPVRQCDFYENRALCHDVRRKLEFWLDPAVLHMRWDPTWNQWKHLLAAKMEVDATFVSGGKYRKRRGEWELDRWETALPSRLAVKLPSDFQQQVETARATHRRFGQYSRALEQIRLRLEYHAIEKAELERACSALRMPGDFDISQINWRVDYDPFFYRQLARRARRIYLFRDEYIFDVEKAVVVETPQLGHATYVFAKPRNMDTFLAVYTKITKEDIRRNRDNAAEKLGFLGRVIHGSNPKAWLKEYGRTLRLDDEAEATLLAAADKLVESGAWKTQARSLFGDIIMLVRDTGMRNERELYRVRIENIDWKGKVIFVPDSKTPDGRRMVPMSDRVVSLLRKRCGTRREGWIFTSKRSESGHLTTMAKRFREARTKAGLPEALVLYCGRHDYGTRILKQTGNLAAVMKTMGHKDVQTAMQYQHPELEIVRAALNQTATGK